MAKALIVSAGNNANEYLARHIGELGYTRPTIVASGGEARRRMDTNDFEVVIINTPLPDEFGHELGTDAVEKTDAGVILLAKTGTAEQIADKLQDFGVLVLAKPFTGAQFRQAVQIAASSYKRLAVLRTENAKLLLARAIQLFMPGKPQVWYLDLFAGKNDCEAVARAGEGGHKEINRTNLTKVQIAEALEKPVVKKQLELLRLRRNCPAFAQGAKIQIESCGPELTIEWSCSGHVARLQANLQKLTYRVEIE